MVDWGVLVTNNVKVRDRKRMHPTPKGSNVVKKEMTLQEGHHRSKGPPTSVTFLSL